MFRYRIKQVWLCLILAGLLLSLTTTAAGESAADPAQAIRAVPDTLLTLYREQPEFTANDVVLTLTGLGLLLADEPLQAAIQARLNSEAAVWTALSAAGDPRLLFCTSALLAARGTRGGRELFYSSLVTGVNTFILKALTGMARPHLNEGAHLRGLTLSDDYMAFPSAHTAASFAAAAVVDAVYPDFGSWAYGAAALVGAARVAVDAHWPSNVVIGAVVGYLSARHVLRLLKEDSAEAEPN